MGFIWVEKGTKTVDGLIVCVIADNLRGNLHLACVFSSELTLLLFLFQNYYNATEVEKIKSNTQLCKYVILFGECKRSKCNNRHLISCETDHNDHLPKTGTIIFKIQTVQNVCSFTVKLLENRSVDGQRIILKDKSEKILKGIKKEAKENAIFVKCGEIYAYESKPNVFHRFKVTNINMCDGITKLPTNVTGYCLETGLKVSTGTYSLFEISSKWKTIPPQGILNFLKCLEFVYI